MPSSINSLFVNMAKASAATQSFILEGSEGELRDRFVLDFICGINCEDENPGNRPCGECASCRQIKAGTTMDVYHMSMSGVNGYKTRIDVIPFIDRMSMGAYGRHNIGIVDRADVLSEVHQNKLLKTLEEPEENAVIILVCANRDNLIPTVRSRCRIIRLNDYIEEQNSEEASLEELAAMLRAGRPQGFFYEYRALLDKKIKSRELAISFLGMLEDGYRDRMVSGDMPGDMAVAIELVEKARMDIYRGMIYSKALKRLFIELSA